MLGKRIGRRTYLHIDAVAALDEPQRLVWERAIARAAAAHDGCARGAAGVGAAEDDSSFGMAPAGPPSAAPLFNGRAFNVVRLERAAATVDQGGANEAPLAGVAEVALLHYPDFFTDPFPALAESWRYVPTTGEAGYRSYRDSLNPPILHRKELLLAPDHPDYATYAEVTAAAEAIGLFAETTRIGYRRQWLALVRDSGYRIAGHALPRMVERVKIKLREQDFDYFSYGDEYEPPYLYGKSRYLHEEQPSYPEQLAFDEALADLGRLDLSGYGPPPAVLRETLARHRWEIDGLELRRATTPPELDAPCGRFLRFRDLIECGETWHRLAAGQGAAGGIDNRPREAESWNALLDLAEQLLDPVIDWFGMIRLTYAFSSPQLTRHIPARIDPKRDQHAAYERNRRGNLICERGGAAVDFLVEDEDMWEVAQWVAEHTPFDRLYFYAADRPIHVSYGPEHNRQVVWMREGPSGRRVPKVMRP